MPGWFQAESAGTDLLRPDGSAVEGAAGGWREGPERSMWGGWAVIKPSYGSCIPEWHAQ